MPSVLASTGLALTAAGLAQAVFPLESRATCSSTGLSCHSSITNTCCVSSPGGLLLQTQFWDTDPATGPSDAWTIHGLWPDNCNGGYESSCDSSRDYNDITQILQNYGQQDLLDYMNTYWVSDDSSNESFWEHEFGKHATCISTLDPKCYSNYQTGEEVPDFFNTVVNLYQTLPTYDWLNDAGITPSNDQTYTLNEIVSTLENNQGGSVYIGCDDGVLYQVYYYFNAQGPVQNGNFEPATASVSQGCPSSGIQYLPKSS